MVGAAADLLVDRERDPHRRARLGRVTEVRDGGHDLRHAGLVVGAEQRRAVARDDVVADARGERRLLGRDRAPGSGRRAGRSARRRSPRGRSGRRPAPGDSGVVSTWAISPITGAPGVPGQRREHVAVLVQLDVGEADLAQLVDEQAREVELLRGARDRSTRPPPPGCRSGRSGGSARARPSASSAASGEENGALAKVGEVAVEGGGGLDPERQVRGRDALVGRVDVRLVEREPRQDRSRRRGRRARRRAGSHRRSGRAAAGRRAPPRTRRARAAPPARRRARARAAPATTPRSRPRRRPGAASRSSRSKVGTITAGSWSPTSRIETFASRLDRDHRLLQDRRATLDAVHVDGRLGPGAEVELLGRRGVGRARPGGGDLGGPGGQLLPALELGGGRRHDPGPQRLGHAPVAREHARRASASARASR